MLHTSVHTCQTAGSKMYCSVFSTLNILLEYQCLFCIELLERTSTFRFWCDWNKIFEKPFYIFLKICTSIVDLEGSRAALINPASQSGGLVKCGHMPSITE